MAAWLRKRFMMNFILRFVSFVAGVSGLPADCFSSPLNRPFALQVLLDLETFPTASTYAPSQLNE